jgi:hypothetical protein
MGIIIVEGKYQDKNLYIQNGDIANGVGHYTYEVKINGTISTDEVNSNAFEIDFTAIQIKPGTSVIVEINHKDDCNQKILNPDALKSKATFLVTKIYVDKKCLLNWETKDEVEALPYTIEQYRWNKWVPIVEVKGLGRLDINSYQFQTTAHSGENKFRVKQTGFASVSKFSNAVSYVSKVNEPSYAIEKDYSAIEFSYETLNEVYDLFGNIIKRGIGNNLTISTLSKGNYYLSCNNLKTDFKKK